MKKRQRAFFGFAVLLITAIFTLAGCNNGTTDTHTHSYSATWSNDAAQHWHECEAEGECDTPKKDAANHTFGEWITDTPATETTDGSRHRDCTVCGYTETEAITATGHTHTYSTEWSHNETQHWRECTSGDGAKTDVGNHSGDPCAVCGYDILLISLTINEIPAPANSHTGRIVIVSDPMKIEDALEGEADPLAYGEGIINDGSVTVSLKNFGSDSNFTVSGSYYVGISVDDFGVSYIYTNGKTHEELGMENLFDFSKLPKLSLPAAGPLTFGEFKL